MPRLPYRLGSLIAAAPLLLVGCGGKGTTDLGAGVVADASTPAAPKPAAPTPAASTPAASEDRKPGEQTTPDRRIDTDKAVDIIKGEVRGGEADAGPTPMSFLEERPDPRAIRDEPFEIAVPVGLPPVAAVIPLYNPMTKGKVELGRQLYFDQRISRDGTVSCASCHDPVKGWTDNLKTSVGIGRQVGSRNAPTVLNTVYGRTMFWDGRAPTLEGQAQGPIQNKIEMGDQSYREIVERLRAISGYREQFHRVFGTDVTLDGMAKAIAAFERTALTGNSPYDRYALGDPEQPQTFKKLTEKQKRGMVLFGLRLHDDDPFKVDAALLRKANCTACHAGSNFTDEQFHNLGVGFDEKKGEFADLGRWVVTPIGSKSEADRGSFKTPTIRDISRTAPYMHDGSEGTLEQVVELYNKGGNKNPSLDGDMKPLNLTAAEKSDLVEFMKALTGETAVVPLPRLPAGPDGRSPDPREALNSPEARTAADLGEVHRLAVAR